MSNTFFLLLNTLATSCIVLFVSQFRVTYPAWLETASLCVEPSLLPGTATDTGDPETAQRNVVSRFSSTRRLKWKYLLCTRCPWSASLPFLHRPHYLQWVIVILPDLFVLLFDVLEVFFPHRIIQELRALKHRTTGLRSVNAELGSTLSTLNALTRPYASGS